MTDVFPRFVDLVLLFLVVEAAVLAIIWHRTGRGIAPADVLPGICSGALMLIALRLTIQGAGWPLPMVCLAAAGVAHLIDLRRRWRR